MGSRAIRGARSFALARGEVASATTSATAPESVLAASAFSARRTHCSRVRSRETLDDVPAGGAGGAGAAGGDGAGEGVGVGVAGAGASVGGGVDVTAGVLSTSATVLAIAR